MTVDTLGGRLAISLILVVVALVAAAISAWWASKIARDSYSRYYGRKLVRYVVFAVTAVALAVLWRPFAGQIGVVLGLFAAGIAFRSTGGHRSCGRMGQHHDRQHLSCGGSG